MEDFLIGLLEAVLAVGFIVATVAEFITKRILKKQMSNNELNSAVIEAVDRCRNVVKLKDLDSSKVLEIHGEGIDSDICEGDRLYV